MKVLYYTLVIVVLDQLTKILVKGFSIPFININYEGMYYGQRIPIIGDFFQFTFVENPGMAFGIDFGDGVKLWLSLFSVVASIGLLFYLYHVRNESFSLRFSLALILGGAVGNLIDRVFYGLFYGYAPLFYGKVVDFLDFDFFNFEIFGRSYDRWPIFNIADMAVSIGVLVLLIFYRQHQEILGEDKELSLENNQTENLEFDYKSEISINSDNPTEGNEQKDNGKPDNREDVQG
ncbi:MAG: signal peptidase II [Ignavibacteria bacterium]|nr:signal peptidase II [Ignavibacteria bacterium]MDP3832168.1 signal peptidase II [Ignavibacteriaceae bacterium]